MANELAAFGAKLSRLTDAAAVSALCRAAGKAGQEAVEKAATDSLGGDRAFSNMRRRSQLSVDVDVDASSVTLDFVPGGLWRLAEQGRRGSGTIRARRGEAVRTPLGPRARSSWGQSRGLRTADRAMRAAQRKMPEAAAAEYRRVVGRVMGG
jgi:hypothetical protein